jgi:hypothetical protein
MGYFSCDYATLIVPTKSSVYLEWYGAMHCAVWNTIYMMTLGRLRWANRPYNFINQLRIVGAISVA